MFSDKWFENDKKHRFSVQSDEEYELDMIHFQLRVQQEEMNELKNNKKK